MSELLSGNGFTTVILFELSFTCALVGLIWLVQLVHYPLFGMVGESTFADYEKEHCHRISFVVIPLMCAEALFCILHLLVTEYAPSAVIGALLLAVIWGSTFFIQVPLHNKLSERLCSKAHRALVLSNWIRTLGWTARAALLLAILLSENTLPK